MEIWSRNRMRGSLLLFLFFRSVAGQRAITCQRWRRGMRRSVISCARVLTSQRFSLQRPTIATPVDMEVSRSTCFFGNEDSLGKSYGNPHESVGTTWKWGQPIIKMRAFYLFDIFFPNNCLACEWCNGFLRNEFMSYEQRDHLFLSRKREIC